MRSANPKQFLRTDEDQMVTAAIANAELQTSAEIKLIVCRYNWTNIRDKARRLFHKHGLHKTEQRNAVLILIVTTNREFLVFGDSGITKKVGVDFWVSARDAMQNHFRADRVGEGMQQGIEIIAKSLSEHFPRLAGDKNELPDEVTHDE
jgi:uncharacterized membrane protein